MTLDKLIKERDETEQQISTLVEVMSLTEQSIDCNIFIDERSDQLEDDLISLQHEIGMLYETLNDINKKIEDAEKEI